MGCASHNKRLPIVAYFKKNLFQQFVIENHVIGFFENPIKLKSGRHSNWYVNWRSITNDVFLIDKLADFIIDFLRDNFPDCETIYGVPEGASKTAIISQYKWAKQQHCQKGSHVLSLGRSLPKQHGDSHDKFFIGMPQGKVAVLEDTTTTGSSLIQSIDTLLDFGIDVTMAIGLTSRSEKQENGATVADVFAKKYNNSISFVSLSDALDLLPLAIADKLPDRKIIQNIMEEFAKYGTAPLQIEIDL